LPEGERNTRRSAFAHRAFRTGQKEDTMTIHDYVLLIDAAATLLGAIAQLIAAMRRPP
jgi:hypothetical protein